MLPASLIIKLQDLVVLNLADNKLSELPDELCAIKSLKRLHLSHNRLIKLPANIGKLNLDLLDVSFNKLDDLP